MHGYDRAELLQLAAQIGLEQASLDSAALLPAARPTPATASTAAHQLVTDVLAHPDLLADNAAVALADVHQRTAEALCHEQGIDRSGCGRRRTATC